MAWGSRTASFIGDPVGAVNELERAVKKLGNEMIEIDREVIQTDVLVAGGGVAGLMAAISAARKGATVVVAEKANSRRSGCGATGNDHFLCYCPPVHGQDMEPILKEVRNSQISGFHDPSMTIRLGRVF